MEAVRRRVRRGKEYDALFPKPEGKSIEIKKSADVNDTVSFIQRLVPFTLNDTKAIARKLKGKSLEETCSNVWHFAYDHIPYKKDQIGIEQIRRPARSWWETRNANQDGSGIDCDCYSVFLSSILMAMSPPIPHKYRITKYPKRGGETPYWQHIYLVVPKDGKLDYDLKNRSDYIVMDCVKNDYDDEQPYLEKKDYNMRLDYLNGLSGNDYEAPVNVDAQDLADIEDQDLGKIRIGQAIKKAAKGVAKVAKGAVKVAGKVGKGLLKVTATPLRNGVLLGMKINLMNIAKRIRYAYLTDDQARKLNLNMTALNALRKIKDKVESIYKGAGGNPNNLRLAILKGKGNKDNKVPLAGFEGLSSTYADEDEYNILHNVNGFGELGDPVDGSFLAVATAALGAVAKALSSVKGLFPKGSKQESDMQQNSDPTTTDADIQNVAASMTSGDNAESLVANSSSQSEEKTSEDGESENTNNGKTPASSTVPALPNKSGGSTTAVVPSGTQSGDSSKVGTDEEKKGIIEWAKTNPVLATGIVAGAATGAWLLLRKNNSRSLSGLSGRRKKKKKAKKKSTSGKIKAVRIS